MHEPISLEQDPWKRYAWLDNQKVLRISGRQVEVKEDIDIDKNNPKYPFKRVTSVTLRLPDTYEGVFIRENKNNRYLLLKVQNRADGILLLLDRSKHHRIVLVELKYKREEYKELTDQFKGALYEALTLIGILGLGKDPLLAVHLYHCYADGPGAATDPAEERLGLHEPHSVTQYVIEGIPVSYSEFCLAPELPAYNKDGSIKQTKHSGVLEL